MPITEYVGTDWKNSPDKTTPLSAENLNKLEKGLSGLSSEVKAEFEALPVPKDGAKGEKGDQGPAGKDGAKGATGTAGKDFQVTNAPAPIGSIAVMQADGWKALTVEEFKAHLGIGE